VVLILAAFCAVSTTSVSAATTEQKVKAAFLYNFVKFVKWPDQSNRPQDASPEVNVGILGDNPFGDALSTIDGKQVKGRQIRFIEIEGYHSFKKSHRKDDRAFEDYRTQKEKTIEACQLLFICDSEKDHVQELLALTQGRTALTVSDLPGFIENKGMIGLVKDRNKLRFEINLDAVKDEKIEIRAQLLSLAKRVYKKDSASK
jgi:hypothetical protein